MFAIDYIVSGQKGETGKVRGFVKTHCNLIIGEHVQIDGGAASGSGGSIVVLAQIRFQAVEQQARQSVAPIASDDANDHEVRNQNILSLPLGPLANRTILGQQLLLRRLDIDDNEGGQAIILTIGKTDGKIFQLT